LKRENNPFGMFVDHGKLQSILRESLGSSNIEQQFECEIENIKEEKDHISLELKSGEQITTQLLVVAEGSGSGLAEKLGIRRQGWYHNQRALVTNLKR
jgi:2-polyprenyl-6-methoxyphenol hydroxylase-like FAD-dependent oxidoreductase